MGHSILRKCGRVVRGESASQRDVAWHKSPSAGQQEEPPTAAPPVPDPRPPPTDLLLLQPLLHTLQVLRARVARDELLRLVAVEELRLIQELTLKVLLVNRPGPDADLNQHGQHVPHQVALDKLPAPLAIHDAEQDTLQSVTHGAVAHDVLTKHLQPHVEDRHLLVLRHKRPVLRADERNWRRGSGRRG